MQSSKTVILGEASEESDSEEIELGDGEQLSNASQQPARHLTADDRHEVSASSKDKTGLFGSRSLFASIGQSGSTFAKLAKYSPYDLLNSTLGGPNLTTSAGPQRSDGATARSDPVASQPSESKPGEAPLHRSIHMKNQQMRASINHLYKHPLQLASKGMHTMSQRLVRNQKVFQDINDAALRIKREQANLDIKINMIV